PPFILLTVTPPPEFHRLSYTPLFRSQWVRDEGVDVHYYPPYLAQDDGTELSVWPERWPKGFLDERRHTRSFAKNFVNLPVPTDGEYWTEADVTYGDHSPGAPTTAVLAVDGAVTTKRTSDYTGLAV